MFWYCGFYIIIQLNRKTSDAHGVSNPFPLNFLNVWGWNNFQCIATRTKSPYLSNINFLFLTPEQAEQVRVNKVDSCTLWNCRQHYQQIYSCFKKCSKHFGTRGTKLFHYRRQSSFFPYMWSTPPNTYPKLFTSSQTI